MTKTFCLAILTSLLLVAVACGGLDPSSEEASPTSAAVNSSLRVRPPQISPGPLASKPGPNYVGPTADITAVANALSWFHKSLTILVTAPAGLALTRPVNISIAYLSPWGGVERITQDYLAATGNRFLRWDPEGDGQPRSVHLDITLSQIDLTGTPVTYNIPVDLELDPLYSVSISPLSFTDLQGCALLGNDEINFFWYPPDVSANPNLVHFSTSTGQTTTIPDFAWSRAEVSASASLHQVSMWYHQTNIFPGPFDFDPSQAPLQQNLVPGASQAYDFVLDDDVYSGCVAEIRYTTTYQLAFYFDLP